MRRSACKRPVSWSILATAYFNLRAIDIELDVLARSIDLQRRAQGLARVRYELGHASGLDVAQQQALLDNTLTQLDVLWRQRSQFQHALATLTGTPAPLFEIAPRVITLQPPAVPIGVPSDVLERRPDVASAERAMAAANAQIGVANAAFYPSINLGGFLGTQSRALETLFSTPAYIWSFGASLAQVLFDGGRLRANVANAQAGHEATVANYKRVVLTTMQEVEDGIIGLAALERAHAQALVGIESAKRVLNLATVRYEGGVSTSLDVITTQQLLLTSERLAAQLQGQRLLMAVFLVKALGGDWEGAQSLGKL
ncbi:MAG: efflux transporter outer membrane subunit [Betaproteobacteria bacterium]|nr:efflux transporter outer membrane subunit [Betaproteobacteria bacterium]